MNSKYAWGWACLLLMSCSPSPDKLYAEANTLFAAGNYKEAVPLYEEIQQRDANNVNVYPKLTISYAMIGDWSKCSQYAKLSIERQADFYEVYEEAANCQLQLKKPEQALELYQEALKKYPDRYEMKEEAGLLQYKQKKYSEAAKTFQELAKAVPNNRDFAYNAAVAFEQLKQPQTAEKYYKQIVKYDPTYANAWFGLAQLAQEQGKTSQAIDYYKKTLDNRSDHLSALLNLAQVEEGPQPKDALKHWKMYLVLAESTHQDAKFITKAKDHIRRLEGGPPPTKR